MTEPSTCGLTECRGKPKCTRCVRDSWPSAEDDLALIEAVLKGYPPSMARADAMGAVARLVARTARKAAQVANGVAPAPQCPKGCGLMGTFFDGWRCNHCGETARGVAAGSPTYGEAVIRALESGTADAETQQHAAAWLRAAPGVATDEGGQG